MDSSHYKKSNAIQNHHSNKAEEAVQKFASMMIERMTALKNENWEKGWFNGVAFNALPQNFSGRTYNASNSFLLMLLSVEQKYTMPVFMTFKQAMDQGVRINKSADSFPVVYWDFTIRDKEGSKISINDYKNLSKEEQKDCVRIPFLKYYPVFNVDQTNLKDVLPEKYNALREKFSIREVKDTEGMYSNKALDRLVELNSWYCPIQADKISNSAFYSPAKDMIVVPMKAQFKKHENPKEIYRDGMEYYATMLHEMTHSTGHPDRLNRDLKSKFGDPKYAKDELISELTAAMIGNSMGFDSKIADNSAKYLDHWISVLKEEPKFIVSVMADVNKAADMILDKVDEQRLALGEKPYLSKNMVAVEAGYSLEPEFKPSEELMAGELLDHSYGNYDGYKGMKLHGTEQGEKSELLVKFEEMKAKYPDALIIMRVGNVYELFGSDAEKASNILDTDLIQGTHKDSIPLTAFPASMLDKALPRLVKAGEKIAICETTLDIKNFVKKVRSKEIPTEKSFLELSDKDQQKEERKLRKKLSKDPIVTIINSYAKKYEPSHKSFKEGEYPLADSLLFNGLINYHQYSLVDNSKFYVRYCLENNLEPNDITAKQIWRNLNETIQTNQRGFPSSGDIQNQREQMVGKYNDRELKVLTVKEIIQTLKNPITFLNELEKKDLISGKERNEITEFLNENIMAGRKKKSEEHVTEKKEAQVKTDKIQKQDSKVENKSEVKSEEKNEDAVKQPREPQMVTVNGDKVSHAHIYNTKDNPEQWFFVAKINGNPLRPVRISPQLAEDYLTNKDVPEMMNKLYPTKLMPKVPEEEFKNRDLQGMTIEKFNVYKESNAQSPDFGKYKFYALVDGKKMSTLASQNDLNAYFDRVQTQSQLVEKIFGEKLQLASHYNQFKLPEGIETKDIKFFKDKKSEQYVMYLDMGAEGKTKRKLVSWEDTNAFFTKKATISQLGAKYLGEEMNQRLGMKQTQKIEESKALKIV